MNYADKKFSYKIIEKDAHLIREEMIVLYNKLKYTEPILMFSGGGLTPQQMYFLQSKISTKTVVQINNETKKEIPIGINDITPIHAAAAIYRDGFCELVNHLGDRNKMFMDDTIKEAKKMPEQNLAFKNAFMPSTIDDVWTSFPAYSNERSMTK